jgi:hypothetical protein
MRISDAPIHACYPKGVPVVQISSKGQVVGPVKTFIDKHILDNKDQQKMVAII